MFQYVGLLHTYPGLILAHTVLAVPFVVITVLVTLEGFDLNLMRAASSLGASPWTAFRRVMLPIIFPGVASGALFAFATSLDELVVTLFVAGIGYALGLILARRLNLRREDALCLTFASGMKNPAAAMVIGGIRARRDAAAAAPGEGPGSEMKRSAAM